MKIGIRFLVFGLGLTSSLLGRAGTWDGRVYDVVQHRLLTQQEVLGRLSGVELLVLGEKHDTPSVQRQQAEAIARALEANPEVAGQWILGWEFLNRRDQASISAFWSDFLEGKVSGSDFLDRFLGKDRYRSYLPILEAAARANGRIRGLNLSRDEKAPVVAGGLAALDPALIPPGFAMGGVGYRERFESAMGGHANPSTLENYFQAQCLTDDVMAYELLQAPAALRVVVTGSFHADYFDGVVSRLRSRDSGLRILSVRYIDASEYNEADFFPDLHLSPALEDSRYGILADWIWFSGEPQKK